MPRNVAYFERIAYAAVILNLVVLPINREVIGHFLDKYPIGVPVAIVLYFGLQIFWIWLVARRRQNWARWVSLIYVVVTLPFMIKDDLGLYELPVAVAFSAVFVLQCVAVSFLFTRSARPWFRSGAGTMGDDGVPPLTAA
jgi:hypothetical protein